MRSRKRDTSSRILSQVAPKVIRYGNGGIVRRSRVAFWVVVLSVLSVSCARSGRVGGEVSVSVQSSDPALTAAADRLGVRLVERKRNSFWFQSYAEDLRSGTAADLYASDWARDVFRSVSLQKMELAASLWKRSEAAKNPPRWLEELRAGPAYGFFPTDAYAWGLFYNKAVLAKLGGEEPRSIAELESLLARAKSAGFVPIALGAAFGWPGAAWFVMLDLRINGAAAVWDRYTLGRSFDDEAGTAVARELAVWRDAGFFSPNAAKAGMSDALAEVENGNALFVLTGTFSIDRFRSPASVAFMPFPRAENRSGADFPGELVGLSGFFMPAAPAEAKSRARPVVALVSSYITEREADPLSYRVPIRYLAGKKSLGENKAGSPSSPMQKIQAEMLKAAAQVVPAYERAFSAQTIQNTIPLWANFFAAGGTGASDFIDVLAGTIRASEGALK